MRRNLDTLLHHSMQAHSLAHTIQDDDATPGSAKPTLPVPLPMISMVRNMKQGPQLHILQAVLGCMPGEAHNALAPLLNTADMSLIQLRHSRHSAYALAQQTSPVQPRQQQLQSPGLRDRIHTMLSDPASSVLAQIVSLVILLCIVVTTGAYCYASLPDVSDTGVTARVLDMIELVTTIVFTAEYLLRLLTCARLVHFLIHPLNVLDLVAILPWYIELLLQAAPLGVHSC